DAGHARRHRHIGHGSRRRPLLLRRRQERQDTGRAPPALTKRAGVRWLGPAQKDAAMSRLPLAPRPQTFLGLPAAAAPVAGSAAIFGAVHGTPYVSDPVESATETGPDAVRRAVTAACLNAG